MHHIINKAWALPDTIVGDAFGLTGYLVGTISGTNPSISFGHIAITLGNTISYGVKTTPEG